MKRKIAVIYIICFVSAFLCPFRAFAYDSQYVNEFEKWTANESAEWLELKGDSATGYMQYFYGDNCAYFHFFVQSSDFAENDDSLYITADIENLNRAYSLRFSADSDDSGLPCKIYKNFGTAPAGLRNILFAFEFNDKADKNYKNIISLSVCSGGNCLAAVDNLAFGSDPSLKQQSNRQPSKQQLSQSPQPQNRPRANLQKPLPKNPQIPRVQSLPPRKPQSLNMLKIQRRQNKAKQHHRTRKLPCKPKSLKKTAELCPQPPRRLSPLQAGTAAFGTAFLVKGIRTKKAENSGAESRDSDLESQKQSDDKS